MISKRDLWRTCNVEAQYVEMMVRLYSYACKKKIKKALAFLKGIKAVNGDYKQQKVTVWGICNKYDALTTVRTKRKEARFWNSEDNDELTSPSPPPKMSEPLTPKGRPLNWNAWKKVFMRSYSYS